MKSKKLSLIVYLHSAQKAFCSSNEDSSFDEQNAFCAGPIEERGRRLAEMVQRHIIVLSERFGRFRIIGKKNGFFFFESLG